MTITADKIVALAPHVDRARAMDLADEITAALPLFGAQGHLSIAHFMAQACHETGGFLRFTENLNYTHATAIAAAWPRLAGRAAELVGKPEAIANAAYGGRNGNRLEASGDGWTFRGRGIFQLTGRANYAACGEALKVDLVGKPDLVAQTHFAVRSALWFWKAHDCIEAAARDDCDDVTRRINGSAMLGLNDRRYLTERAKLLF